MDRVFAFIDTFADKFGGGSPYLITLYKFLIAVGVSFVIWFVLMRILSSVKKRTRDHEFFQINSTVFKLIKNVLRYGLILVLGTYLINLFNIQLFEKIFYAVLIMLVASPVNQFARLVLKYFEENVADNTETKVDNIIFDLLNKFVGVIVYVMALILSLDVLGINVMPFVAGAGVAGIVIGFAAKDTLSNLIAGILLIIDRPFEIGDRIEVWSAPAGSATWGDVMDIGLRATKIQTTDNIIIIIPNNEIMTRDIVNYTLQSSSIRVRINIGVSYDADIPRAKAAIIDAANTFDWIQKEPAPRVVVRNFGESSVDLQLRVWISDARKRMDAISFITDKVKEIFDKENIEIPYPKRDITIINKN